MSKKVEKLAGWRFKAWDETEWMPAEVPGCVHTDLVRNGLIPDPFYETNEKNLQWIDKKDWEYETVFDAPAGFLEESRQELVFEGLDTYAEVIVNGRKILSADNMFRLWQTEVTGLLKPQGNSLLVRFRSPIKEDLPKLEQLGYALPAANDQSELGGLGDKKISVFARKAPYHYGWDWGPRFVTSGIWRDAWLTAWSDCRITDLFIRQDKVTAETAWLTAVVTVEAERAAQGTLRLSAVGRTWEQSVAVEAGFTRLELPLVLDRPALWWCRGLGEATLHAFRAELELAGGAASEKSVRTGLRSVRLVRERDEAGASFFIELNGKPVFAKGANHIPNDSFLPSVTDERYRHEIATAAASNMNMLRVWGGGVYEEDLFYELCDENGILVWQDFMFACSMYPGDAAFLENVKAEAEDNLVRLRNHPCLALWCGNNEMDSAWAHFKENAGWGWKQPFSQALRDKIWNDYEAVFHRILPEAVERLMPGMAYWPSSPLFELTGDMRQHATGMAGGGDIHYWGVWHGKEPFEDYNRKIGRFMSEYGFQSFPEWSSVQRYAEDKDMELESEVMLAHQKNGRGNTLIKEYMDEYLPVPKDFPSFLYASQVLQADAMAMAIEAHRRSKPYCMGTLYWQINDCWPVASWSSMDYYGKWKAIQYHAKRSFRDVMVSAEEMDGVVRFTAVNDLPAEFRGRLTVRLIDFSGRCLKEENVEIQVAGGGTAPVLLADRGEWLGDADPAQTVLAASLAAEDGALIHTTEHYFARTKALALQKPDLRVEVSATSDGKGTRLTLTTDTLAKQVWLTAEADGIFSDNYFDLLPGVPHTVEFLARPEGSVAFLPAEPGAVTVCSMADFVHLPAQEGSVRG